MDKVITDVAIIGGGASGLAAAVAAAEGGASVTVFEKASTTGGTGNMGMGPLAVESRLQRLKQIALTKDEAFKIFMDYTHWRVDARLVRAYLDKSADTIDWLEKMGVEFVEPAAYFPGANFTWHLVKPSGGGRPGPQSSATMMKCLTENAKELGVKILLQTPATKIVKENGRIAGVVASDKTGTPVQVNAKAVIIASGGFGDSPEWIKKYTGYEWGKNLFSFRIPGLIGEGIRMAWEAGAGETEMTMELIYGVPGTAPEYPVVAEVLRQPNLMVNLQGDRFLNEEIMGNTTFTGNAIARQKKQCAFIIFDEAIKKHYETKGLDFTSAVFHADTTTFDTELKKVLDRGNKDIFIADSLEELASKTGIDLEGLRKTVNEYNKSCETRDELFNKRAIYLKPIKQPKFYAARFFPGAYGSLGGIRINYRTEVLNKDYDVIPGLYAVGTDVCTIYGDSYVFVLPGNTMGFALNSGRMAGENAAKYTKKVK
jgi:fumarate reductase flavoprotein subunit